MIGKENSAKIPQAWFAESLEALRSNKGVIGIDGDSGLHRPVRPDRAMEGSLYSVYKAGKFGVELRTKWNLAEVRSSSDIGVRVYKL